MEEYKVQSVPTWILFEKDSGAKEVNSGKGKLKDVLEKLNKFFVD